MHLDNVDEKTCYDCIDSGFYRLVMIDAKHEPFQGNVATPISSTSSARRIR